MKNIKNKILRGMFWKYAERIVAQLVILIVSIVLARILSPQEYEIVAITMIFITFANIFIVNGLGTALIQDNDASELDFSTIFIGNIVFSIFLYTILFVLAPFIGNYYNKPMLSPVLRVMSLQIIISSVSNIQQSYIMKKMEFKKFFFSTLIGVIISAIIGISMALKNYGVWALVFQYLTNNLINIIVLFFISDWKPKIYFSWKRFKKFFNYGYKILLTGILLEINTELRDLFIGKKYSVLELAYINKSKEFPRAISTNISATISSVIFPALVLYQDDKETLRRMACKSIRLEIYILAPFLLGLAAISKTLVYILFTEKWLPCVIYMQIMCMQYLFQPVQVASIQVMKAVGESGTYFKLQIIKTIIGILLLFFSIFYFKSVFYVVLFTLFTEIIAVLINFPTNKRIIKYNYKEQFIDCFFTMFPSFIMFFIVNAIENIPINTKYLLIIQIICGVLVYLIISEVFKLKEYLYIKELLYKIIKKRGR